MKEHLKNLFTGLLLIAITTSPLSIMMIGLYFWGDSGFAAAAASIVGLAILYSVYMLGKSIRE